MGIRSEQRFIKAGRGAGLVLLGFIAGSASAGLGIGGGVILVPCLIALSGMSVRESAGTSLAVMVPGALIGAATHYTLNNGSIVFDFAGLVLVGTLAGARAGARIGKYVPERVSKMVFSGLLFFLALRLFGLTGGEPGPSVVLGWPFLLLLGIFAGTVSAFLGIGGGVIMVPAFYLLFALDIHQAVGTSVFVIGPTALAGVLAHKSEGVRLKAAVLVPLIAGAGLGAVTGGVVAEILPAYVLRSILGLFMISMALKMLLNINVKEE